MITQELMQAMTQERTLEVAQVQRENEARALQKKDALPSHRPSSSAHAGRNPLLSFHVTWLPALGWVLRGAIKKA